MPTIDNQKFAYAAAGIALIAALGSFIQAGSIWGLAAAIVAAFGAVFAYALFKYGYLIIPLFTTFSRIVQVTDTGYEIPPAQDVILKNVGGIYYASVFLIVKIYESTSEKNQEENMVFSQAFERAISSVKFVTKFAMMVYVKDMTEFRSRIETKRAEAQLRLARERDKPDPDVLKLDKFEREVAMWDMQISKLTSGIKPMASITYLMTTATGVSKEAAAAAAKAQANELRATISNALNVEVTQLTGEEMLKCFEWEHMVPPTPQEMEQSVA